MAEGLSHIDYLEFHLPAAEIMMVCLHSDALVHMLHLAAVSGGGREREAGGRVPKPMGNSLGATVATAAAVGKDGKSDCWRCSQDFNGLVWLEADANPPWGSLKFKVKYKQGNHLKVATCAQGSGTQGARTATSWCLTCMATSTRLAQRS